MEYSALTKEDKKDIFEIVNSTHLHLKGNEKKLLKSTFCNSWKINKNVGAFELFMKLYESENVYDKMNDAFLEYVKDGHGSEYYRNHKHIPYAKHVQRMQWRNEEVEKAERELEEIKESNGTISRVDHEYELNKLKQEQLEIIREKSDTIGKLRNTECALREKLKGADRVYHEMKDNYEKIIQQMSKTE